MSHTNRDQALAIAATICAIASTPAIAVIIHNLGLAVGINPLRAEAVSFVVRTAWFLGALMLLFSRKAWERDPLARAVRMLLVGSIVFSGLFAALAMAIMVVGWSNPGRYIK